MRCGKGVYTTVRTVAKWQVLEYDMHIARLVESRAARFESRKCGANDAAARLDSNFSNKEPGCIVDWRRTINSESRTVAEARISILIHSTFWTSRDTDDEEWSLEMLIEALRQYQSKHVKLKCLDGHVDKETAHVKDIAWVKYASDRRLYFSSVLSTNYRKTYTQ